MDLSGYNTFINNFLTENLKSEKFFPIYNQTQIICVRNIGDYLVEKKINSTIIKLIVSNF